MLHHETPAQEALYYQNTLNNFADRTLETLSRYCHNQCKVGHNELDDEACNACYVNEARERIKEARQSANR